MNICKTKITSNIDQKFPEFLELFSLRLFTRLLTNAPFITDNALHILERYCQNDFDVGVKILRNFILHRIPIREKSLNILLNLTQNENNAIDFVKTLYRREEFKQNIEVKSRFWINYMNECF